MTAVANAIEVVFVMESWMYFVDGTVHRYSMSSGEKPEVKMRLILVAGCTSAARPGARALGPTNWVFTTKSITQQAKNAYSVHTKTSETNKKANWIPIIAV